jgi:hypothetical protein
MLSAFRAGGLAMVGVLFIASLFGIIVLYELITGESMFSKYGGWVTTRENDPQGYWFSVLLPVVIILVLNGSYILHHTAGISER